MSRLKWLRWKMLLSSVQLFYSASFHYAHGLQPLASCAAERMIQL